jgi:hypothetical protein
MRGVNATGPMVLTILPGRTEGLDARGARPQSALRPADDPAPGRHLPPGPVPADHDVLEVAAGRLWLPRPRPSWPRSVKRCIRIRRHGYETGSCSRCGAPVTAGDPAGGWVRLEVAHGEGCPVSDAALAALVVAHDLPREVFPELFGVGAT